MNQEELAAHMEETMRKAGMSDADIQDVVSRAKEDHQGGASHRDAKARSAWAIKRLRGALASPQRPDLGPFPADVIECETGDGHEPREAATGPVS